MGGSTDAVAAVDSSKVQFPSLLLLQEEEEEGRRHNMVDYLEASNHPSQQQQQVFGGDGLFGCGE